jgi:DNA relaxase NicK
MTTVGLGWLRGTFRIDHDGVHDLLRPFFGDPSERSGGTRFYNRSSSMADGRVTVAWEGVGNAGGTVMVEITQTALDVLGWDRGLALLAAVEAAGFHASRLDLFVDDRQRHADARAIRAAILDGSYVSHAQPGGYHEDDRTGAATAYLGSRQSERMLRAYDKDPNGADPRTRFELELKGEGARSAMALLLDRTTLTADPLGSVVGLLLAFVDFRDRAGTVHGDRSPRLDWWAALVGSLGAVRGVVAVRVDSLARRARWVARQVAPTLAAIWARPEYGSAWLNEVLSDGLDRSGGFQWARS